jgi:hypothetical protein
MWLSPIIRLSKENGKLKICVYFKKLNATTKKNPYPSPFIDEEWNTFASNDAYSILDGYSSYH